VRFKVGRVWESHQYLSNQKLSAIDTENRIQVNPYQRKQEQRNMTNYTHWFIRARLKTRQLLLLVALAEEGNIHRAAQVLNMTQPAASKLLKDLEEVLEVSLFDRLPRGMRPTWYGETMIRHARVALASLNQAHDEVMALKAGRFGQVNVGAITAPGLVLLPPAAAMVKRDQPNLRIALEIETSPVLLDRLEHGKLAPPINVIETAALLFITRMLQQSDMIAVLATDVARYYASHGIVAVLPLAMPCHMDAFGIITRTDRLLSPAAKIMMNALKAASLTVYGKRLDPE